MSDLKKRRIEIGPEHENGFRRGSHCLNCLGGHGAGMRLSHTVRSSGLPKHWKPKMDADGRVRMNEELELLKELEQFGIGGWFTIR